MATPLPISLALTLLFAALLAQPAATAQNSKTVNSFPPPSTAPLSSFANTSLSAAGHMLIEDYADLGRRIKKSDTDIIERYGLIRQCRTYYVPATLEVLHPYVRGEFSRWHVRVLRERSQWLSVLIPVHRLEEFFEADAVVHIEISFPLDLKPQE